MVYALLANLTKFNSIHQYTSQYYHQILMLEFLFSEITYSCLNFHYLFEIKYGLCLTGQFYQVILACSSIHQYSSEHHHQILMLKFLFPEITPPPQLSKATQSNPNYFSFQQIITVLHEKYLFLCVSDVYTIASKNTDLLDISNKGRLQKNSYY